MKRYKKYIASIMIVCLLWPCRVLAEEHVHVISRTETYTTSSSEEYCAIYTITTIEECDECSWEMTTITEEKVPHNYELVPVDRLNEDAGCQNKCTACGHISGPIIYPQSLEDFNEQQ